MKSERMGDVDDSVYHRRHVRKKAFTTGNSINQSSKKKKEGVIIVDVCARVLRSPFVLSEPPHDE